MDRGGSPCPSYKKESDCALDNDTPLPGAHPVWRSRGGLEGRTASWRSIALACVDCFHYSVVTGSTVRFGDIHPSRWYTKLLTDLQIILSLGLTVLAVSRHFSLGAST